MPRVFDSIDPKVVLALSGEFTAPTDPIKDRLHTLAFLLMATLERGSVAYQPDPSGQNHFVYYDPTWAPVRTFVRISDLYNQPRSFRVEGLSQPLNSMDVELFSDHHSDWRSPAITVVRGQSDGNPTEIELERRIYNLGNVSGCVEAKNNSTNYISSYFNIFEGWSKEGEFWVPPTPDACEQAAGSAG